MRSEFLLVSSILALGGLVCVGCGSDSSGDSPGSSGGNAGAGGSAGQGGTGGTGGSAGEAGSGGEAGSAGGSAGAPMFDPVDRVGEAFSHAGDEAKKSFAAFDLSFVEVQAASASTGTSYETTPFSWHYTFAACDTSQDPCGDTKGIEVVYPGWTTTTIDEMPMGAYVGQQDFPDTVKLDFAQILDKVGQAGLSQDTCPIPSAGDLQGYILLHGTINAGVHWFWEFSCAGTMGMHYFDAGTGVER